MKKYRSVHLIFLVLLLVLCLTQGYSQFSVWQNRFAGEGEAVGINPLNSNTIYAQDGNALLNVSRNQGKTWTVIPTSVPFQIREIIVHPNDTLTLFITNFFDGLWKSTNGGTSWSLVIGPGVGVGNSYGIDGESVTYDPVHPDTMYAGNFSDGSLYRSSDRGSTWTLKGAIGTNLCALAVRPDSSNILLAGSGNGRISKSTNSGATWYQVKSAGSTEIPKIVINPANPQIAYGSAFSGSPSVIGVWKTTNGGESWFLTSLQGINMWSLDMDKSNPNTLYSGTFEEYTAGIYKTTDGGTTWQFNKRGFLPYNSCWNLKIDQQNPSNVYVGVTNGSFGDNGVFKLGTANAGVEGIVRDTLNNNPITTGYVFVQPPGSFIFLSNTSGAYSFYRFVGDTVSSHTYSVYINSVLFKQQTIPFISDSILQKDIFVVPGSIRGTVYNDLNHNGVKDGGEAGIFNWTIQLTGQSVASTTSDVNGNYVFNDLFPGSYTVAEQSKSGWTQTAPVPSTYSITVNTATRDFIAKDFGNYMNHGVVGVSPTPFTNTVSRTTQVQATFDTSMNTTLFNDTTSWIVSGERSGRHRGSFSFNGSHTLATFTPNTAFQYGEVVTVDIVKSLKTANGNSISPYAFQFTVVSHQGPGTFVGRIDYQTGSSPYGIVAGDVDNDGDNDLVTANLNANTVSVLTNNGHGSFGSRVDYAAGTGPVAVALADVDNDGDLDIVVANSGASTITVLKNNGNGTFAAAVNYSAANPLFSIATADFDGDGYADILTVGPGSGLVEVHKNDGTGAFPTHTTYAVSGSPWSIVAVDVDNDGVTDAIDVSASASSTVAVLVNLGGGVLSPQSSYTVGTNSHGVIAADVTGDHQPDIIAANSGSNTVSVLPKNGVSFGPRTDYSTGTLPWGLASGDIQGDSLMDIVASNITSNSISILKNNGGGSFTTTNYSTGSTPHYVAVADVDGDGDMDIITANSGTDSISVFLNSSAQSVAYIDGWNLISLPVLPIDSSKSAIYPTATSNAFAYQGSYVAINALVFGEGYWLKFSGAGNQLIRGEAVAVDTIDVRAQWNIIGGLSAPVAVSSLTTIPGGIVASNYFKYNGSYQTADTLRPGLGYWVKTTQAGKLVMASSQIPPAAKANGDQFHCTVSQELRFDDNSGKSQTLYFSSNADDAALLGRYELPPLPPSGGMDIRFSSQRLAEVASARDENVFPVQLSGVTYPLTISWKATHDGRQWILTAGSIKKSMNDDGSVRLTKQPVTLSLSATQNGSNEIPLQYMLGQNYPNPFNPSTEIQYGLPAASRVKLTIFDVLGREVGQLVDEQQDAGYYHISWSPNRGSGIYFYKLTAVSKDAPGTSFVEIKKMILLK